MVFQVAALEDARNPLFGMMGHGETRRLQITGEHHPPQVTAVPLHLHDINKTLFFIICHERPSYLGTVFRGAIASLCHGSTKHEKADGPVKRRGSF